MQLSEWIDYIKTVHPSVMDLGLERISKVARALRILDFKCPVITVTGTNGKGSCVALLEQIYLAAGYSVGVFTSPHLWTINEEIRLQGQDIADEELILAFECIEKARGDISLTLFEYMTLAALVIFQQKSLDLVILEVGLGGRLDAVNVVDADIGVITAIGLDHQAWLGETRAKIALEKSGIFRSHRPAVCGDADPPKEFLESLSERNIPLDLISRDFAYDEKESTWDWIGPGAAMRGLKKSSIFLQNAASALMVVHRLQSRLPVPIDPIQKGLETVFLPGRYQVVREKGEHVFDVAHNPQAALVLLERLQKDQKQGQKTIAVFSMLSDKDIAGVIRIMKGVVNSWHIATLETPRAASIEQLKKAFEAAGVSQVNQHADIKKAYQSALNEMRQNDRLVVFGSFYTVAAILKPMV